jgi:hypothetical protein
MSDTDLNGIRRATLDRMDESRRHAKGLLIAATIVEGLMAVAVIWVTDFGDRTQLLIFLCACLVYAPLALGMFALRALHRPLGATDRQGGRGFRHDTRGEWTGLGSG